MEFLERVRDESRVVLWAAKWLWAPRNKIRIIMCLCMKAQRDMMHMNMRGWQIMQLVTPMNSSELSHKTSQSIWRNLFLDPRHKHRKRNGHLTSVRIKLKFTMQNSECVHREPSTSHCLNDQTIKKFREFWMKMKIANGGSWSFIKNILCFIHKQLRMSRVAFVNGSVNWMNRVSIS